MLGIFKDSFFERSQHEDWRKKKISRLETYSYIFGSVFLAYILICGFFIIGSVIDGNRLDFDLIMMLFILGLIGYNMRSDLRYLKLVDYYENEISLLKMRRDRH